MPEIDVQHGITSLVVILSLHLVLQVGKLAWGYLGHKNKSLEEKIDLFIKHSEINDAKVKTDLRRIFNVLRHLAGKDWQKFRKIMDDDLEP